MGRLEVLRTDKIKTPTMYKLPLTILAGLGALALVAPVRAEILYAVNGNNELVTFDSTAPTVILTRAPISNTGGDAILNIDFRPNNGQLYGLSSTNNLYNIDLFTGAAALVGATGISGGFDYAFDFNPVPDRIRVATDTGSNFRVNPNNAALTPDAALFYIGGDPNAGTAPSIAGAAYTNNFGPSPRTPPPGTSLYYIDFNLDILALSPNPNAGELMTIGSLGINVTGLLGFDITDDGEAFASLSTDGVTSSLYRINLLTGSATFLGDIGTSANDRTILDFSAPIQRFGVPDMGSSALLLAIGTIGLLSFHRRAAKTA